MVAPTKEQVEQAYALLDEHYKAQDKVRVTANREFVGRFFKTPPTSDGDEESCTYVHLTTLDAKGYPIGRMIQIRTRPVAGHTIASFLENPFANWPEIDEAEFRKVGQLMRSQP